MIKEEIRQCREALGLTMDEFAAKLLEIRTSGLMFLAMKQERSNPIVALRSGFNAWSSGFKQIEKEAPKVTGESYPSKEMDGGGAYIEQLHKVDKYSYSFRYPLNKDGDVSLGSLERINIGQFSERMERLSRALEQIDCYFGQILSAMADMHSDYSPY
jgi:hypothetical protein